MDSLASTPLRKVKTSPLLPLASPGWRDSNSSTFASSNLTATDDCVSGNDDTLFQSAYETPSESTKDGVLKTSIDAVLDSSPDDTVWPAISDTSDSGSHSPLRFYAEEETFDSERETFPWNRSTDRTPLIEFYKHLTLAIEEFRTRSHDYTGFVDIEKVIKFVCWVESFTEHRGLPLRGYIWISKSHPSIQMIKDLSTGSLRPGLSIGQVLEYPCAGAGVYYGIEDDMLYLEPDEDDERSAPPHVIRWVRFRDLVEKPEEIF